jgi:prepilin-type N-terminal cleavage/methylation domain-containing protein
MLHTGYWMYKFSSYVHPVSSTWHQSQPHGLSIINQKMKPSKLRPVKDRNGFTLLEILLAIFILATVLSTVFASYTGTLRMVSETESQAETYQMARIAFERILEDLESAYMPESAKISESEGTEQPFEFTNTSLRFPSRAHVVFSEEDQSWGATEITYEVREGDEGEGMILYRRERPQWEEEEASEEGEGGLPLCEKLVSVNFTYYDAEGKDTEDWDPESEEGMPKIISVALEFVNPSNPEMPLKFATSTVLHISKEEQAEE